MAKRRYHAGDLSRRTGELFDRLADKAVERVRDGERVVENVAERTERLFDRAAGEARRAAERAPELFDQVREAGGEVIGEIGDKAAVIIDRVEEAAGQVAGLVREEAGEIKERAAEAIQAVRAGAEALYGRLAGKPAHNVIELKGVSIYHTHGFSGRGRQKRRPGDELVLSDVDLTVAPGEMVYLIGRVGSGKSTLLKTLYAEVPLYEGQGRIVDYDLRRLRRRDIPYLRRNIGIVFQDYQLLTDRNVWRNLHYVLGATGWKSERLMHKRIEEVLGMVGLINKEYKMPYQLSGGEQQRLSIARALLNSPKVILADEPTGNLDPAAADEIMALFRRIADSGCAIVMSTHNLANIQAYPARTLRFAAGRVEQIDIRSILGI